MSQDHPKNHVKDKDNTLYQITDAKSLEDKANDEKIHGHDEKI